MDSGCVLAAQLPRGVANQILKALRNEAEAQVLWERPTVTKDGQIDTNIFCKCCVSKTGVYFWKYLKYVYRIMNYQSNIIQSYSTPMPLAFPTA